MLMIYLRCWRDQQETQWGRHTWSHPHGEVLWTERDIEALRGSCCPQVTEGQGGYREVSKTRRPLCPGVPKTAGRSAPHGPQGLQTLRHSFPGQAPQGAGTEDSLCAMSWLRFKSRSATFLLGDLGQDAFLCLSFLTCLLNVKCNVCGSNK